MIIFCCSANHSLLARWQQALQGEHAVYQVTMLEDINLLLRQKISPELMLLHVLLVDPENCRRLHAALPECRLFVLSDRPGDEEGLRYLGAGALGYGNSYIAPSRLAEAVRALANGRVWVGQRLMQRLISHARRDGAADGVGSEDGNPVLGRLSRREYQIARLVADGLSNARIGEELGITERTVKAHLSSIYQKTGARGRLNLALLVNQSR